MSELDDWVAKACRDAATRIVTGDRSAPPASTRENLELFYALTALLPDPPANDETGEDTTGAATPGGERTPGNAARPRGRARHAAAMLQRSVRVPLPGFAALLVALAFATVLLALARPPREPEPEHAVYLAGTGAARSARGVALLGGGELTLFASGLSDLEAGYRYVAWSTTDERHERIGTLTVLGPGRARLVAAVDAEPSLIEVTIEPSAATGRPTGPLVLAGFAGEP